MNILVIGGSSGIGLSAVNQLSQQHNVFATYHTHPVDNQNAKYFQFDVLNDELDISRLPDSLDGLVYCPGSIQLKPLSRFTEDNFIQDYRLQVIGAVKAIQVCLPLLKRSEKTSSIVMFSTVAVDKGFPFHSLVSSSKGAIEGLTRALAAELAPKIRVNAIAPSITDTPLALNLLNSSEKKEANGQRHPLRRVGEPQDMANVIEFLLTDKSSWITGQILHVDGGLSSLKV